MVIKRIIRTPCTSNVISIFLIAPDYKYALINNIITEQRAGIILMAVDAEIISGDDNEIVLLDCCDVTATITTTTTVLGHLV